MQGNPYKIVGISYGPGKLPAHVLRVTSSTGSASDVYVAENTKMICANSKFVVSAWIRCTSDFDGTKDLLVTSFYGRDRIAVGSSKGLFPSSCNNACEKVSTTFEEKILPV